MSGLLFKYLVHLLLFFFQKKRRKYISLPEIAIKIVCLTHYVSVIIVLTLFQAVEEDDADADGQKASQPR